MLIRTHIMVHHSLTADGSRLSWGAIRRYHVQRLGWRAIGYHFGVELVGDHYEVLLGRSVLERAAACPQGRMNLRALHVCCVGNFDLAPPPPALLEPLVELVLRPAMAAYGIPAERIVGHRDFNPAKSCPGRRFDLEVVRRLCRPAGSPARPPLIVPAGAPGVRGKRARRRSA